MKKTLIITLVMALILFVTSFQQGMAQGKIDACQDITIRKLRTQVPIPPAIIVSKRGINGVCEVILDLRGQYVPLYAGKNYVIAGEMFQEKNQLTQARIEQLKAKKFLSLKPEIEKCVAMVLRPKQEVKQTVYMLTDPVCPYCHRAERKLKELAEKYGAAFKIVFHSVHPPLGTQKAIEVVCRGLSAEEYLQGTWNKEDKTSQYQCRKGIDLIRQSEKIARKLGVGGVPVFYLEDGRRVVGANMVALKKALTKGQARVSHAD